MKAVKQNYGEKVLVQASNMKLVKDQIVFHVTSKSNICNVICSMKILQITTRLSCWRNMVPHIWYSMMIYKYGKFLFGLLSPDVAYVLFFLKEVTLMLQGTAAVVLAGLVASLKLLGGSLPDHTFLFFGAGEVRLELSL